MTFHILELHFQTSLPLTETLWHLLFTINTSNSSKIIDHLLPHDAKDNLLNELHEQVDYILAYCLQSKQLEKFDMHFTKPDLLEQYSFW